MRKQKSPDVTGCGLGAGPGRPANRARYMLRRIGHHITHRMLLAVGACAAALFAGVLAGFWARGETDARLPESVGAFSALAMAFLTLAYVITTSRQLGAMQAQLQEMKRSRELTSQPVLLATPTRFRLEKPRTYYSPPEKGYSGASRYHAECKIANCGSSAAVSIHSCACLILPGRKKEGVFHARAEYIEALSEQSSSEAASALSFMFSEDDNAWAIDAMRSQHPRDLPILRLCTVYKNLLGACFGARRSFQVVLKEQDQDSFLKDWHSQISTFSSRFKHEIARMREVCDSDRQRWAELFDKVKADYSSQVGGEDQDVRCIPVPGAFGIEPITEEQYQTVVSLEGYGHYVPRPDDPCPMGKKGVKS